MKCSLALLPVLFFFVATAQSIHGISGSFVAIDKNFIVAQTAPNVYIHIPLGSKIKFVSSVGATFPQSWLIPGDDISIQLDKGGRACVIQVHVAWYSGTAAFISDDRLTLLEGEQFFTTGSPIYLNGDRVNYLTEVVPGDQVLVRFDPLSEKVVGAWAFNPAKTGGKTENLFAWKAAMLRFNKKNFLRISVKARTLGKVTACMPGVFKPYALNEIRTGQYRGEMPVPDHIVLPQSRFEFAWSKNGKEERWIPEKTVSIFTESPRVMDVQPSLGSKVYANPPFIYATFDPDGTPADPDSLQLFLDRKDITHKCFRDANLIFFSSDTPLPTGTHFCILRGKSLDSQYRVYKKWHFVVKQGEKETSRSGREY